MQYQELSDYIGAESCVDFRPDVTDITSRNTGTKNCKRRSSAPPEYPPVIPSLTCTDNLQWHTPSVMRKYSTADGRLVIREEKVDRRREYFQARRENGRLQLKLVPDDNEVMDSGDERLNNLTAEKIQSESIKYDGIGVNPCGGFVVAVTALTELPPPVLI